MVNERHADGATLPAGFWLALAFGLALRVWYFSDLIAQPWFGYPLVDALTFDRTALGILRDGYQGAFSRPPLYPLFLAAVYRLFGHSAAAVVWIQFALGLAALVPAYRLGERWFGERAALAGVWIGACYPLRIFFEAEALDVTLFTFLFLVATWKLWQAIEEGVAGAGVSRGPALRRRGAARPNVLLALPFIAAGAAFAFRVGWKRLPALGAAGALGVALAIAPAAIHNWRAEGAFIPVAANGGVNFFLGNERGATGLTPVPPGLRWEQTMVRPLRAGQFSLSAQDRWWYARAAEEIRAAPGRWLRLLGKKTALLLNAAESSNNKALEHFTAVSFPVRHYRWWFGVLVCLALPGVVADPAAPRSVSRPSSRDSAFRSSSSSSASATACPSCRCSHPPPPPAPGRCSARSAHGTACVQPGWPRSVARPVSASFPTGSARDASGSMPTSRWGRSS